MIKLFLVILFFIHLNEKKVNAQSQKGRWIQSDVTIHWNDGYNLFLYNNASVESFICDEYGTHKEYGRFLIIINNSIDTIFYRASPQGLGNYKTKKDIEFVSTVSNMLQYYPVMPRQSEIVEIHGYETAQEKKLRMKLIIDFKFFHPHSTNRKSLTNSSGNKISKNQAPLLNPTNTTIRKNKDNSFYIFLTTSIEMKPKTSQFSSIQSAKTIFIISKPLLHEGNLTDDMGTEKRLFIAELEKYFINDSDAIKQVRKKEISTHYGKPYSKEVLKNSSEGHKAIEAYRNSIKETLEGLAQFDFVEF